MLFSFGLVALMLMWLSGAYRRRHYTFMFAVLTGCLPDAGNHRSGQPIDDHSHDIPAVHVRPLGQYDAMAGALAAAARSGGILVIVGAQILYELRSLQGIDERDIIDIFEFTGMSQYARPQQWMVRLLVKQTRRGCSAAC